MSGLINNNTNPAVTTSAGHFLQAWQELYNASYDQSNLMKPEWLDALIIEKRDSNIVPIGVLNYKFNVLDSQATQKNLIYLGSDSLLHDVTARTQAPYYTREIYLASSLIQKVRRGTVTFQFPTYTLLQNNPVTITSLFIDFGDGQTATLSPGGSASILLDQVGSNTFKMTASFSNGSQKVIRATMEVEGSVGAVSSKPNGTFKPSGLHVGWLYNKFPRYYNVTLRG